MGKEREPYKPQTDHEKRKTDVEVTVGIPVLPS